jgi:hypothetical protein
VLLPPKRPYRQQTVPTPASCQAVALDGSTFSPPTTWRRGVQGGVRWVVCLFADAERRLAPPALLPIQFGDFGEEEVAGILGGPLSTTSAASNNVEGYILSPVVAASAAPNRGVNPHGRGDGEGPQGTTRALPQSPSNHQAVHGGPVGEAQLEHLAIPGNEVPITGSSLGRPLTELGAALVRLVRIPLFALNWVGR